MARYQGWFALVLALAIAAGMFLVRTPLELGLSDWQPLAERIEGADLPTLLTYGHGDVVRGQSGQWHDGLEPFVLSEREGRY
ncbi:MAG: hypothetical protein ACPGSE_01500, partial [Synechococcus sp.]